MSDLFERLRVTHDASVKRNGITLFSEAADEIERRGVIIGGQGSTIKDLKAEIERLEGALQLIVDQAGYLGHDADGFDMIGNLASEALNKEQI